MITRARSESSDSDSDCSQGPAGRGRTGLRMKPIDGMDCTDPDRRAADPDFRAAADSEASPGIA